MSEDPVRASTRVSIGWSGAPAYEDTDTLVLTINGFTLDLRVFTEGQQVGSIDWSTVGLVSEGPGSTPGVWATAEPSDNPVLWWDNLIDSRPPPPVDIPDEGRFETLSNGDVLESGRMYNPVSGTVEEYAETWRRLSTLGAPYVLLERLDGPWGGAAAAPIPEKRAGPRAFVARIGKHALGLAVDTQGKYAAWRDALQEASSGWSRIYQFGSAVDGVIPRLPADMPQWSAGAQVTLGTGRWIVHSIGVKASLGAERPS